MSTNKQELIPYEEIAGVPALIQVIPALVQKQRDILAKIIPYVDNLKVTDETSKANAFKLRDQIKLRLEEGQGERMPLTRALDMIRKEFTTTETEFKNQLQRVNDALDTYAKAELTEQRKKEAENAAKVRQEQNAIELESKIKMALKGKIDVIIGNLRESIGKITNAVTDETLAASEKKLSGNPRWIESFEATYFTVPEGIPAEQYTAKAKELLPEYKTMYFDQASSLLKESLKLLPIALKNKEEAQRLAKLDEQRRTEEARVAAEEEAARVEGAKVIAQLDNPAPDEAAVKTKWKINVTQNAGWLKIIAFWYEHDPEAKSKGTDDLARKTFASCKIFAEKKVNKDGTRIEHPGIQYVEDVKAKK